MEQKFEMVQANKKPDIMIKKLDSDCIHVRLERRFVRPGSEQYPEVSFHNKCYPVKTFENMEALRQQKNPINWVLAGGFVSCTVINDPRIMSESELKEIQEYKEQYFASRRPAPAQTGSLESAVAEIKRLKRKLGVHN